MAVFTGIRMDEGLYWRQRSLRLVGPSNPYFVFILFQIVAVKKSGGVTLYDVVSGTAICHVKLPDPFCLSPQLPCICADGKILVLIGAQIDDENEGSLDKEVR